MDAKQSAASYPEATDGIATVEKFSGGGKPEPRTLSHEDFFNKFEDRETPHATLALAPSQKKPPANPTPNPNPHRQDCDMSDVFPAKDANEAMET
mmetsp:Transcript_19986/g.60519  ORF Transcript_19986/g.60519 Transcript_19986/m.60519 type:complete len:95 (-) Transcript_19986:151-435(-)